jgi:hypothetical protein
VSVKDMLIERTPLPSPTPSSHVPPSSRPPLLSPSIHVQPVAKVSQQSLQRSPRTDVPAQKLVVKSAVELPVKLAPPIKTEKFMSAVELPAPDLSKVAEGRSAKGVTPTVKVEGELKSESTKQVLRSAIDVQQMSASKHSAVSGSAARSVPSITLGESLAEGQGRTISQHESVHLPSRPISAITMPSAASSVQPSAASQPSASAASAHSAAPSKQVSHVSTAPGQQMSQVSATPGQQVSQVSATPGQQVSHVSATPGQQVSQVSATPGQQVSATGVPQSASGMLSPDSALLATLSPPQATVSTMAAAPVARQPSEATSGMVPPASVSATSAATKQSSHSPPRIVLDNMSRGPTPIVEQPSTVSPPISEQLTSVPPPISIQLLSGPPITVEKSSAVGLIVAQASIIAPSPSVQTQQPASSATGLPPASEVPSSIVPLLDIEETDINGEAYYANSISCLSITCCCTMDADLGISCCLSRVTGVYSRSSCSSSICLLISASTASRGRQQAARASYDRHKTPNTGQRGELMPPNRCHEHLSVRPCPLVSRVHADQRQPSASGSEKSKASAGDGVKSKGPAAPGSVIQAIYLPNMAAAASKTSVTHSLPADSAHTGPAPSHVTEEQPHAYSEPLVKVT